MLRSLTFFVVAWLYQVVVLPVLLVLCVMQVMGKGRIVRRAAGAVAGHWARTLVVLGGARLTVHGAVGVPRETPVLFASNHQGAFDIGIIAGYVGRPIGFVSKVEIGRIPSVGTWMRLIGCIFLDRGDSRRRSEVVGTAAAAMRRGDSLVIFPEGTRSNGPTMRPFRTGAARMAIQAQVPIVPLTMKNTYRMRKGDEWWIQPSDVEMVIGAAIPTEGLCDDDVEDLTARIRQAIQTELDRSWVGDRLKVAESASPDAVKQA